MMAEPKRSDTIYLYRGVLPGWLGLLLLAPLLLVVFSLVLALLAGGTVAALLLPLFLRRRFGRAAPPDQRTIELDESQYTRIESSQPRLPTE
jgi:hypothetical protein